VGAELFHADGRADMTKPVVVPFRDFVNAPNAQPALHDAKQAIRLFCRPWKLPARSVTGPLYNVLLRKHSSEKSAVRLRIDTSRYLIAHKYLFVMRNENK
jgi:hypothetical protein